jgi:hypothetical protein
VATQQARLENLNSGIGLLANQREQLEAAVEIEEQGIQQLLLHTNQASYQYLGLKLPSRLL